MPPAVGVSYMVMRFWFLEIHCLISEVVVERQEL